MIYWRIFNENFVQDVVSSVIKTKNSSYMKFICKSNQSNQRAIKNKTV